MYIHDIHNMYWHETQFIQLHAMDKLHITHKQLFWFSVFVATGDSLCNLRDPSLEAYVQTTQSL